MKTLFAKRNNINIFGFWTLAFMLTLAGFQSCMTTAYVPARTTTVVRREVVPPPWAPQYDNVEQVRYYYLPDVEMYYDVWDHEYIYLHDGNWVFTASYPSYYNEYDVNTAFVVVLDRNVNEPWRTHQSYVSHYPRYYYRSVYDNRDNRRNSNTTVINNYGGVRGFNENVRTPIYRNQQPTNLGNSRDNPTPTRNYNTRPSNEPQTDQRRRIDTRTNTDDRSNNRRESNTTVTPTAQPANRDVPRNIDNNNVPVRHMDNNQPANNSNTRNGNQQNTDTRADRSNEVKPNPNNGNTNANTNNTNANTNSNNNNQGRSVETPRRVQPAVYSGREVGQPVRVKREAQSSREQAQPKEDKKDSKKKDDSKSDNNRSRR